MHKITISVAVTFFILILWIIYLANSGGSNILFDTVKSIPNGDKIGHICIFGILTFMTIAALKFHVIKLWKLKIYNGALLVTTFVIGEEFSQAFIPSRTFDLIDLAADLVGITIAISLAILVNKIRILALK